MKTKCMEWLADERMIPGYGMVRAGIRKCWPAEMVDSFIEQGKAKEIPSLKYREKAKANDQAGGEE